MECQAKCHGDAPQALREPTFKQIINLCMLTGKEKIMEMLKVSPPKNIAVICESRSNGCEPQDMGLPKCSSRNPFS